MARRYPEQSLQALCMDWLKLARPDVLAWHVPNGGKRGAREAYRLKRQGVLAGVCDITVVLPDNRCGQIEMKAGKNGLTDEQEAFRDTCLERGIPWALCRSLPEFQGTINAWCGNRRKAAA